MIRLVATDVDGTLVQESTSGLNPEYFQVIRQLTAQGIQVIVASGRPLPSIAQLFAPVEDVVWIVADGGATTQTQAGITQTGSIPREWVAQLWQDMSQVPGGDGMICGAQQVYIPQGNTPMHAIARDHYKMNVVVQKGWHDIPEEPTGKVTLFHKEQIEAHAQTYIIPKWKDRLSMVIAGEWWLDCMLADVTKATALKALMAQHGYEASQLMASGDNMNDCDMIALAGVGLAVENARDQVKAVAQRVIPGYAQDGVLQEWKKLLKP